MKTTSNSAKWPWRLRTWQVGAASLVWLLVTPQLEADHSAVIPAPRGDASWKQRHESFNQRVAEVGKAAKVIFIGDSITQGWEGAGKEVWAKYYAARNAVNLGIGGDRTQHVLWRLDHGNLEGLAPKVAVVMIGTNNSNGEDNTPGQIAEGVRAIVGKLRQRLPDTKVVLVAIFPRGENYNAQRGKLLQINQVLRRMADEREVFWVDFGHRLVDDEGLIPADIMPDYLHLSSKGYALWADAMEGLVSRLIGESPVAGSDSAEGALTGEWIWTMPGPEGKPVEGIMVLEQVGDRITGKFARGADRWLTIENGQRSGDTFSWLVKRDRSDGTVMAYEMTGRMEGATIQGAAKTEMGGSPVRIEWSARRR